MKERKDKYSREELAECGQGILFEADSPRLPTENMLMFNRITYISDKGGAFGRGEVIAELDITPSLWFFQCHFQNDPVMPGCLGLDAMWQMLGFYMSWAGYPGKGRALGAKNIHFSGEVLPDTKLLTYHIHIKRIIKRSLAVAFGDGTTLADGHTIYHAAGLQVGLMEKNKDPISK